MLDAMVTCGGKWEFSGLLIASKMESKSIQSIYKQKSNHSDEQKNTLEQQITITSKV